MSALSRATLEARVFKIVEACTAGSMSEDGSIELKSEWPKDLAKCARRLAGHANAAGEEVVTWIIGLHERQGVLPFEPVDLADWYPQICKHFDGAAPELLTDYRFDFPTGAVHVVQFDTTARPYVVKTKHEQLEVPWRRGTRVQSATRQDLIGLLVERNRVLPLEYLRGAAMLGDGSYTKDNIPNAMPIDLVFYCQLDPSPMNEIVIPFHKCIFEYRFDPSEDFTKADHFRIEPRTSYRGRGVKVDSLYMDLGPTEVSVRGPGEIDVNEYLKPLPLKYRDREIECRVTISDMHGFICHQCTRKIDIVVSAKHQQFFSHLPNRLPNQ